LREEKEREKSKKMNLMMMIEQLKQLNNLRITITEKNHLGTKVRDIHTNQKN
jgi:hypothetical protein